MSELTTARRAQRIALLGVAGLVVTASALGGASAVRTRVAPTSALAGERLAISARVDTTARRCSARIAPPGARAAALGSRTPVRRRVSWFWKVPVSAQSGKGTAAVVCRRTGSDAASFTVRALPAGDAVAGKTVFLLNCGGCHTLSDAGTTGTSSDLDLLKPTYARVVDRVVNGKGLMPSFKARLSPREIADVAVYVSSVAGR